MALVRTGDDPIELPSEQLLKAVEAAGERVSAADISARSGMDLLETRRQLLLLARLTGADLQVSPDGELIFVFSPRVRDELRRANWRLKAREAWLQAKPVFSWVLRASFGVALISSLAIATVGITALTSSSKDNDSGRSPAPSPMALWGPSPFDFLYYSRPYRYGYGYGPPSQEMGFLQSCFSFLFGDGDPNAQLEERQAKAIAALVRAQGGAVTAEQLAPLLLPPLTPEEAQQVDMGEGWVTDALVRFGGEPTVTKEGDIVYVFPELMVTAEDDKSVRQLGASSRGGSLVTSTDAQQAVSSALQWEESPPGWRPAPGERVRIADILEPRPRSRGWGRFGGDSRGDLEPLVGMEGFVVSDDRDGLPFQVSFGRDVSHYFSLRELRPGTGTDVALRELPKRFSVAPPGQLAAAGALGAVNLGAVAYLGLLLRSARLSASAGLAMPPAAAALGGLYPALAVYAAGFAAVPFVRNLILKGENREIEKRNQVREAWSAFLSRSPGAALRRKLESAKALRPMKRKVREKDVVFKSAIEEGSTPTSIEDFDRRLEQRDRRSVDSKGVSAPGVAQSGSE